MPAAESRPDLAATILVLERIITGGATLTDAELTAAKEFLAALRNIVDAERILEVEQDASVAFRVEQQIACVRFGMGRV